MECGVEDLGGASSQLVPVPALSLTGRGASSSSLSLPVLACPSLWWGVSLPLSLREGRGAIHPFTQQVILNSSCTRGPVLGAEMAEDTGVGPALWTLSQFSGLIGNMETVLSSGPGPSKRPTDVSREKLDVMLGLLSA